MKKKGKLGKSPAKRNRGIRGRAFLLTPKKVATPLPDRKIKARYKAGFGVSIVKERNQVIAILQIVVEVVVTLAAIFFVGASNP